MYPTIFIASAVALLAFSHGVVILGKATRENHGSIYKTAGWFVIIASFLIMGCAVIHSAIGFYHWRYMHSNMEMRGTPMMNWMRGDDYYAPTHRYYENEDYDEDGRRGGRDRHYRDNYRDGRNYNYDTDTSRMSR